MRAYLYLGVGLALAACGTRGPLTLPPGPAKPPLFGVPGGAKASPEKPPVADDSSRPAEVRP